MTIHIFAKNMWDMKKYMLICLALTMTLSFGACSSDDDAVTDYSYEELPAWLIPQAQKMAESHKGYTGDPTLISHISIATGIHGEKVYRIYSVLSSCIYCDLYDENGNNVAYQDVFGDKDIDSEGGWVIIFPRKK